MQRFLRSRYDIPAQKKLASVDASACAACGRCLKLCPTKAVSLGHGLYTKNGEAAYGTAPCLTACPLGIPVQTVAALCKSGSFDEAAALIRRHTPIPSLCAVCDRPCEAVCLRSPVAVSELVMTAAEYGCRAAPVISRVYGDKIAVIGSGPAGLACAFGLALRGYAGVTVFEKGPMPGGMLTRAVPPFLLSRLRLSADLEILRALGIKLHCNTEADAKKLRAGGYDAVFAATGARLVPRGIPGSEQGFVIGAAELMQRVCLGERPALGRKCAVIGQGYAASVAARTALRLGSSVTLLCPCEREAASGYIRDAESDGVTVTYGIVPELIERSGRSLILDCGKERLIAGSVIAEEAILPDIPDSAGADGVFFGGACSEGEISAVRAAAAGMRAADEIHRCLHGKAHGDSIPAMLSLDRSRVMIALDTYDKTPRMSLSRAPDLKHCRRPADPDTASREAKRCLGCGTAVIDAEKCIGCGLCRKHCAFGAVTLIPSPR